MLPPRFVRALVVVSALVSSSATSSLGFAPAPPAKPNPGDRALKRLQGRWVRIGAMIDGQVADPLCTAVEIHETSFVFETRSGQREEYALVLPPTEDHKSAKAAHALDLETRDSRGRVSYRRAHIYKLEGDRLYLCTSAHDQKQRPAELTGQKGWGLLVFLRATPR